MTAAAGDGLAASSGVLSVGVDDSTVELNSDALRLEADGILNSHINSSASIDHSKLAAASEGRSLLVAQSSGADCRRCFWRYWISSKRCDDDSR